jgi:hypothetical protein
MLAMLRLIAALIANLFKSRRRLEAENLFLRHQLNIAVKRRPPRLPLRGSARRVEPVLMLFEQIRRSAKGANPANDA